jgi:ribosome-interacting GTPase 1
MIYYINSNVIDKLKENSSYYPSIYITKIKNLVYASTLVRIKRKNKWYAIHCVEFIVASKNVDNTDVLLHLMKSVHNVQNLYKLVENEKEDILQESEIERLLKIN